MTTQDIITESQIEALRPQVEAANLNFEATVESAFMQANSRQFVAKTEPDKSEIISFVVNFILGILKENVKPKKRGWQIFWAVVTFGISEAFKKKK